MKKISTNNCQTHFIQDLPAEADDFGGSHEELAKCIADFITHEKGGIIIGIEGTWGSGKSTVINLFSDQLSDSETYIFQFNAWSHEGDPLRRIFLEKLMNFIDEKKIKHANWSTELENFDTNHTITKTTNYRTLTNEGINFTLLSALLPLGLVFLKNGLDIGVSFSGIGVNWQFIVGIIASISPFFYILDCIIRYKNKLIDQDNFTSIFLKEPSTPEFTTETFSSGNPTSVEFEKYFNEIIEKILRNNFKKIIMVIDNIDRVSPEQGLSILNTLQTFLISEKSVNKQKEINNKNYFDYWERLWTILPYDFEGLKNLWRSKSNNNKSRNSAGIYQGEDTSNSEETVTENCLGSQLSMIEKKIPVRFFVPPVILSEWKTYFNNVFLKAFPSHKKDVDSVFNIFLISLNHKFATPTPREIIHFINLMGSFHRIFSDDEVEFTSIAYYACLLRNGLCSSKIKDLLESSMIPPEETLILLSNNVREDLAMIIFNLDKQKSCQIIWSEELIRILKVNEPEKLHQFYSQLSNVFWAMLNSSVNNEMNSFSFAELVNSINCFGKFLASNEFNGVVINESENIYKLLGQRLLGKQNWEIRNSIDCEAIIRIIPYIKQATKVKLLQSKLAPISIIKFDNEENDHFEERILNLLIKITEIIGIYENSFSISLDGESDKLTIALLCLSYIQPQNIEKIIITLKTDQMLSDINSLFSFNIIQEKTLLGLINLYTSNKEIYSNIPFTLCNTVVTINQTFGLRILEFLLLLRTDPIIILNFENICKNGTFFESMVATSSTSSLAYQSHAIILLITIYKTFEPQPPIQASPNVIQYFQELLLQPQSQLLLIDQIVDDINKYSCQREWVEETFVQPKIKLLSNFVMSRSLDKFSMDSIIKAEMLFDLWEKINNTFEKETINKLITILMLEEDFNWKLLNHDISLNYVYIYIFLLTNNIFNNASFIARLRKWVLTQSKTELSNNVLLPDFITLLKNMSSLSKTHISLGIDFNDLLFSYYENISNTPLPNIIEENWMFLNSLLSINQQKVLNKRYLEYILENPGDFDTHKKFVSWGSFSKKELLLYPQLIRKIFSELIIQNPTNENFIILRDISKSNPHFLRNKKLIKEDVDDFIQRINALENTASSSVLLLIQEIKNVFI